jgi:hypothetical protein
MKTVVGTLVGIVAVFVLIVVATLAAQPPALMSMQCGQGVIVRNGDQVLLDAWETFNPPPNTPTHPAIEAHPSKITIGQSIADRTKLCVETSEGATCLTVKDLRSKAAK